MSLCFIALESNKLYNQLILSELEAYHYEGLSLSLVVILPYIDIYRDISIANLAKMLGYSRQAMHKNIKKLEELGYVEIKKLPSKKETSVFFSEKGEELMKIAKAYIDKIEDELTLLVGEDELLSYKKNQIKMNTFFNKKRENI